MADIVDIVDVEEMRGLNERQTETFIAKNFNALANTAGSTSGDHDQKYRDIYAFLREKKLTTACNVLEVEAKRIKLQL